MTWYGTLALTLLVGVVACDDSDGVDREGAGEGASREMLMQQPEMDPETMARIQEIQQIQARLEPIQQEALEDPALAGQLEAIQERVETVMRAENSDLFARMDRLQEEIAEAQAGGDPEQMQELMMRAQGLQQEAQAAQAAVMQRPEIRGPVQEFEAAHRARMTEIDPEAGELLDRFELLVSQLQQPQ